MQQTKIFTDEEKKCEELYEDTYQRNEDGRYHR